MKIQVLKKASGKARRLPIRARISSRCRPRRRRSSAGALHWRPAAPVSRRVAVDHAYVRYPRPSVRLLRCRAWRRCVAACSGDARRGGSSEPLTVKIGTFVPKSVMPTGAKELVGLFTSEPLVAAAWDGRPVYRLAESVVESDDRSRS